MINKIIKKIRYELQFNNPHYYTRVKEHFLKKYYKRLLRRKIKGLAPIALKQDDSKLTLTMFSGKKSLYESLAALYSVCFWRNDMQVHYYEDGSMDEHDIDQVKSLFPGIVIFRRKEETAKIIRLLKDKGLEECARLHEHYVFSIRLFDMVAEKKTPYLLQIDSDVLIFDDPKHIWDVVDNDTHNGCYNVDTISGYCYTPDIVAKYVSGPILEALNVGVFLHNFDETFFDFCENIIKNEPEGTLTWHLEQTLFAMQATQKGDFLALPKQYDLGRRERNRGNKIISEHYCHNTGYDMHKDFIYKLIPMYKQLRPSR